MIKLLLIYENLVFKKSLFYNYFFNSILSSQQYIDDLGPEFHEKKRQEFRNQMPTNSIAFFFTSPIMKRSNDTDYMYHQDPNFYYLTGWKEPHGVLVIFKDDQQDNNGFFNEMLFVRERNEYREMWDGRRLGLRGAKKMGFDRVKLRSDFMKNCFKIDKPGFDVEITLSISINDIFSSELTGLIKNKNTNNKDKKIFFIKKWFPN